jgi:hypothetical protein
MDVALEMCATYLGSVSNQDAAHLLWSKILFLPCCPWDLLSVAFLQDWVNRVRVVHVECLILRPLPVTPLKIGEQLKTRGK